MFLHRTRVGYLHVLSCLLLIGMFAACTSTPSPASHLSNSVQPNVSPSPTTHQVIMPSFTPPTQCQPASPINNSSMGPEAQGKATNAQVWALIMVTTPLPVKAKQEVKIVWRMTGEGDFHIAAYSPVGGKLVPDWGPEGHGGSNWNRPGGEWGVGFTFPISGCWDIHVTRENAAGDVWLNVK